MNKLIIDFNKNYILFKDVVIIFIIELFINI